MRIPTTVTVTSSPNPSGFGQPVTFTATVTGSACGSACGSNCCSACSTPTGTVTFEDGSSPLGVSPLNCGKATFKTTTPLPGGIHTITAVYSSDTSYSGSTSPNFLQTVNTASTTTMVVTSVNPSVFGQRVTFTATVSSTAGTPTGTVTFKDGSASLGTGALNVSDVASFTTSTLTVGTHAITAVYGGDTNFTASTSSIVQQTVHQASTITTVASSTNPSVFGQSVTFTATVTANAPGSGTPRGTVTFEDSGTSIGTGPLSSGTATFVISTLSTTASPHMITAVYGGDGNFTGSASVRVAQTVDLAGTPATVSAIEGVYTGTVTVAMFTASGDAREVGNFAATVSWGDSSPNSVASISFSIKAFLVQGSHIYSAEGNYDITVSIAELDSNSTATVNSTADVVEPPLSGTGMTFGAIAGGLANGSPQSSLVGVSSLLMTTEGAAFINVIVAVFSSPNPAALPSDYTASVNWGDGSLNTAGRVGGSGGVLDVAGSHLYSESGTYSITTTLNGPGASNTTTTNTVIVGDAPLTVIPTTITATEGTQASNVTVATFTDGNSYASSTDYSASIDWGDNSPSTGGTITGNAIVGSHTYAEGGSYPVVVTLTDVDGSIASDESTAAVTDQPLSPTSLTISSSPDGSPTTLASTFTDANPNDQSDSYDASVDWGDGSTSPAAITGSGGTFTLAGNRVYSASGVYTIALTIKDSGGAIITETGTATISEAPLSGTGSTFSATADMLASPINLATFTDANLSQGVDGIDVVSNYTATIDWGDGTTLDTSATIWGEQSSYAVMGAHTYANPGTYSISITIQDDDGTSVTVNGTASVSTMLPSGITFSSSEGVAFADTTIATFTDSNLSTPPTDYSATIDWGDGTAVTTGTISGSSGSFGVAGDHAYSEGGTFTVTVTVFEAEDLTFSVASTCNVADPPLSANFASFSATQGTPLNGQEVATSTDPVAEDISAYSAVINWGDGSGTDQGVITTATGSLIVSGDHTYQASGSFSVGITITDLGGSSATVTGTVTVAGAALIGSGTTFSSSEGVLASKVTVATFTDTSEPASSTALIDWGDGTSPTSGAITGTGGNYTVTGSHTYGDDLAYTVIVSISDSNGNSDTAYSQAMVAGFELTATGASGQGTEAVAGTFELATFTDTDLTASASGYKAVINWDDGVTELGVVNGSGGSFTVTGDHIYVEDSTYAVQVTVYDADNDSNATTTSILTIADSTLTPIGANLNVTTGVAFTQVPVAAFTDANVSDPASSYGAQISWGDGSPATTGLVSGGGGSFVVLGSHVYTSPGPYSLSVTIIDDGSTSTVVMGSSYVAPVPVYTVATFTTANHQDLASNFTASIDFGDGSSPMTGLVSGSSGSFVVTATHSFARAGAFIGTVTVTEFGGTSITLGTNPQVADPPVAGEQEPPPPPATPPPQNEAAIPGHDVVLSDWTVKNFKGNGTVKLTKDEVASGLRIHIDDGFTLKRLCLNDKTMLAANNIADAEGKFQPTDLTVDGYAVSATITIGPKDNQGILAWTVPDFLRIWWKPDGTNWVPVPAAALPYAATGNPIPISIEGITPGTGKVIVSFRTGQPAHAQTKSTSFDFTVSSGLNIRGDNPPAEGPSLLTQLRQATGILYYRWEGGVIQRQFMPVKGVEQYQETAIKYVDVILANVDWLSYKSNKSVVTIIANNGDAPSFDNYHTRTFYPKNYDKLLTTLPQGDGQKVLAAVLVHALVEQFRTQIYGDVFETNPNAALNHDVGGAFGEGTKAEEDILQWGNRTQDPKTMVGFQPPPGATTVSIKMIYTDKDGKESVLELVIPLPPDKLQDTKLTRPK